MTVFKHNKTQAYNITKEDIQKTFDTTEKHVKESKYEDIIKITKTKKEEFPIHCVISFSS